MSRIDDEGILLHLESYGDRSSKVTILCENNGLVQTFLKKNRGKLTRPQIYDILHVSFDCIDSYYLSYRNLEVEILESCWKNIFGNALLLNIFSSIAAIVSLALKERGSTGILYRLFKNLLFLTDSDCEDVIYYYIDFLLNVLDFFGIRIDTGRCSVSGSTHDVCYLSPKTGNCVSAPVGEKYKHRLFLLPRSFSHYSNDSKDILSALNILHYFLFKIFTENNIAAKFSALETLRETIVVEIHRRYQRRD
jgi:DNA repair protein RecO (recombination protein O)